MKTALFMAPLAQKQEILGRLSCQRLESCFTCEVTNAGTLSRCDIQRSSLVVVQNLLFDTPEILEANMELRGVIDRLLDAFILDIKEDRILTVDMIKTLTQLKIFGTIASQQIWKLERGGKGMIIEHEGMLAALMKLMFEVQAASEREIDTVRELRTDVLWLLRNLVR